MSNLHEHIARLEAAIKAQESMREALGDEAADAAIAGLRSKIDLLKLQHEASPIDQHLNLLEHSRLIHEHQRFPDIEYMFKHALTQEAAYGSLLSPQRRALHQQVAEAIETIYPDRLNEFVGIIAEHYLRGEAWEIAADYLIRAGNDAVMRHSDIEARSYFEKALTALGHLPETTETLRRRAETQLKQVHASVVAEPTEVSFRRLEAAEQTARKLVEQTQEREDRLLLARIQYEMGLTDFFTNETSRALKYFDQVIQTSSELGDESLLIYTANISGQIKTLRGDINEALALLERARDGFIAEGNTVEIIACRGCLGGVLVAVGRITEGLAEADEGLRMAEETNNLTGQSAAWMVRGMAHSFAGYDQKAVDCFDEARRFARTSQNPHYEYIALVEGAQSKARLAMYEQLDADMHRADQLLTELGGHLMAEEWMYAGQAAVALGFGQIEKALAYAVQTVEISKSLDAKYGGALGHRVWAEALNAADAQNWPEVEAHLAESLAMLDQGGMAMEVARIHVLWGRLCAEHRDTEGAKIHFDTARASFERFGADWEIKRLQALMA